MFFQNLDKQLDYNTRNFNEMFIAITALQTQQSFICINFRKLKIKII